MKIQVINLVVALLFFVSIIGIGIFMQVKLSRNKNKYLGLIMPILSFLLSLFIIFGMTAVIFFATTSSDGVIQSTEEIRTSSSYIGLFFWFLIANIPTAILGGIYLGERNKISVKKSIDKMRIEDL